ncbi:hypothetical protein BXZ70DRAFT_963409 [Cristinia sonorae]|uniref:DUF4203 domain-containing protein n=1 Tax=Cristinia sonorae TaxID=1940300 RepID=A0A8K0XJR8_9AGAR|nr:hypothetical protein BXZ70DRAFT_963409 [Cristinia sonorae]
MSASNASNDPHDYHDLLSTMLPSTSYVLIYSIPLLLVSIILAFAGAFLTLDRTRTFSPRHPLGPAPKSRICPHLIKTYLEGGVGGVAAGFAFGVHLATFLSLLIPKSAGYAPLNSKAFLAICILSALVCSIVGGRWKYGALFCAGISGFTCFSIALSIMLHPALLARIIITAVLTSLGTLLCLIPIPKYSHVPLRLATSAAGSFGTVLCISLLAHIPAWSNSWARFWVSNDAEWGTAKEKGLSGAYCILLALGAFCDWCLHRYFGENPDEKWDQYLADYEDNLPNDKNRAGVFQPPQSLWDRLLSRSHPSHTLLPKQDVYLDDLDTKVPPPSLLTGNQLFREGQDSAVEPMSFQPPVGRLRQPRKKPFSFTRGSRSNDRRIQFSPLHTDSMTVVGTESFLSMDTKVLSGTDEQRTSHQEDPWARFWQDVMVKADIGREPTGS